MHNQQFDGVILEDKWGKTYLCSNCLLAFASLGESQIWEVKDAIFCSYFLHDLEPYWDLRQIWTDVYRHARPWEYDLSGYSDFQLRDTLIQMFAQQEIWLWQLTEGWGPPPKGNGIGDGGLVAGSSTTTPLPISKKANKPGGGVADTNTVSSTTATHSSAVKPTNTVSTNQSVTERYGDNEAVWVIDEQGRPVSVTASLGSTYSDARSSQEKKHQRTVGGDARLDTDDGGHIIGHRFMSDQGLKNLFPQDANLNRGAYKSMENEWEDWTKEGYEVKLTVRLDPPGSDRPDNIIAEYQVFEKTSGDMVFERRHGFNNRKGEAFERVARKDMQDYRG
ncbi:DNA/RNA non-specific endonuclease [Rheinheimera baltica]|uniref:DNA/RNA non-specific endonuclease n=1 Tax=Rheinheimera baltica TaxID=67576 RepID=A0ABT9HW73_9GAMM|nr:DNA/RNA non-specific endonuclease [Rheinheimera baltica]MDP5135228.1 DNA/RNA non-specific endonuclease [Rheinheimera baltica]